MKESFQKIRNKELFRYSSAKRYLKIYVPEFSFNHDDSNEGKKDKFVGREVQMRKLFTWLTSNSLSGSYLITGYRGMGKSLLVKRVIEMIARDQWVYKEVLFQVAMLLTIFSCYIGIVMEQSWAVIFFLGALAIISFLELSKLGNHVRYEQHIRTLQKHWLFDKDAISKVWVKMHDRRGRKYNNIAVTINLGQEVLHERDVLSLITQSVRDKYSRFVHFRQNRPVTSFIFIGGICIVSFLLTKFVFSNPLYILGYSLIKYLRPATTWFSAVLLGLLEWILDLLTKHDFASHVACLCAYLGIYWLIVRALKSIRKKAYFISVPFNALQRLDVLCDRISSTVNEEEGAHPQYNSSFFNFSFGKEGRTKTTPKATVRELEQELLEIINDINSDNCPRDYRAQFILVFDELDKITNADQRNERVDNGDETVPDFDTSVKGFTDTMAYEERKQNVLRLLANMKLFIASVKAKCVFISGHELFDASLADLSDREFAISSIFDGVLNVSSFLSPEREQADVSSMTEMYLATILLPENYLKQKIAENVMNNGVLKDELPSLRWYNEYLMGLHILKNNDLDDDEVEEKEKEIHHVIEFLHSFSVYLSHISNGSPKKIATYFEKYIKVNYDAIKQFDWYDEIVVGKPMEKDVRKQCVLFFSPEDQQLINFIHFIAAPVMNAITNEVSYYGDKLLVSSSFMLDQIYKYHGKGFSWRNLEQMPELLNTSKNPELRDSVAAIMEFLLQTHLTLISSGVFQYKFHKQIAEEISVLSKTSEEAAAIFNFTLNESEAVKRYNTRLLWHYVNLAKSVKDISRYNIVLERIHENLGDIYFSEEDYYRAIHEYRNVLQSITAKPLTPGKLLPYLKCNLKVGMSYEYRRTFENAYMVYCQIINKLIHLKWYEEGDLGIDYVMRLTKDWREKQPVLVDKASTISLFGNGENVNKDRQYKPGLLEDIDRTTNNFHPQYSLDSDKTISGFSAHYTPEKSDVFLKLTAFEDVKYIYQAIIAKLFVVEKMEVSGITQSSIDAAEAEFVTLYSSTNYEEKFMLAVDFLSKLTSILYYKNNFVTADPSDNMSSALYIFDINVMALLDDYCAIVCSKSNSDDAIIIKDDVRKYFEELKVKHVLGDDSGAKLVSFVQLVPVKSSENPGADSSVLPSEKQEIIPEVTENVSAYLQYLDLKYSSNSYHDLSKLENRIKDCAKRRECLQKAGCHLPCNACKYANRSMMILMDKMFGLGNEIPAESKSITLLRNTSHRHVRYLRREHLSALASSTEQLADIMLSCACTNYVSKSSQVLKDEDGVGIIDRISDRTISLLKKLSETTVLEDERKTMIDDYVEFMRSEREKRSNSPQEKVDEIGKLDRALIYYWSASRYFEIASMYHESVHCIERLCKVIEDYLTVLEFYEEECNQSELNLLLDQLFTHASQTVGRQYDNFDMAEIHEFKWLFHLEHTDNIDLAKLTQFPELQSSFLSIVRSKLMLFRLTKQKQNEKEYIREVYGRISPALRNECTFKSEVEQYYTKAWLNRIIFIDLMGIDSMRDYRISLRGKKKDEDVMYYHQPFYETLKSYLESVKPNNEVLLPFPIDDSIQSRLDLIDFLVFDSLVCLYGILKVLPPHNQITTFSNSFIADVYSDLWEWSKYYELLYNLYFYYRYFNVNDEAGMDKVISKLKNMTEDQDGKKFQFDTLLKECAVLLHKGKVVCKDDFGYRYSKMFMNLRHEMDDATTHHIYTNYSAEMAIRYYRAARGINSEGMEYKNLIYGMYVLDDDLRNDTCQSNLAGERYMLNSGVINVKRKRLQRMYEDSRINRIDFYQKPPLKIDPRGAYKKLEDRYEDSLFVNTEY